MKKVFLIGSTFDPWSWENYKSNTDKWIRVNNAEDAEILLFVDNDYISNDITKKRILFLAESIGIQPKLYNLIKNNKNYTNNFDLIGTCHRNYCNNVNIIETPSCVGSSIHHYFNLNKNKLCSMIFSNKKFAIGHKLRKKISEKKFIFDIDKYGAMFNNFVKDKSVSLKDYYFSFSIENCSESGYYTEKINDCFATCTIPIYWGDPDISKIYNTDGILFLDRLNQDNVSKSFYDKNIKAIEENYNIVNEIVKTNNMHYPINYLLEKI